MGRGRIQINSNVGLSANGKRRFAADHTSQRSAHSGDVMQLDVELIGRIFIAAACGAAVGWEREWRRKPAGLRTYMLVTTGSAAFVVTAQRLAAANDLIDSTRVIQGIVGGIGFLGAGAIIQGRGSVEGLTTAAGLWLMGAVGVACGLAYYDVALATTLLAVIIVAVLGLLEMKKPPPDLSE
jgi:putative Mg2+ transporter-C (MgtC) family protein